MTMILSGAGTVIRIGESEDNYISDDYTDIGQVSSISKFGEEYELITYQSLSDEYVSKAKGNYNPGTLEIRVALNMEDKGQKKLK